MRRLIVLLLAATLHAQTCEVKPLPTKVVPFHFRAAPEVADQFKLKAALNKLLIQSMTNDANNIVDVKLTKQIKKLAKKLKE